MQSPSRVAPNDAKRHKDIVMSIYNKQQIDSTTILPALKNVASISAPARGNEKPT
jgi:hypothetical protein